ncbi:protein-L-isoaspartate(D-aspartate) O-methyltransferase [Natronomonas gomsonensis]|uniref:protein-L-isoaspartate(D-aspartate) O-methyltransferase n=1 Tax=Natronomonas gomsonensis TaxID=1046043 RepID=UPI0015BAA515|nr:protein-L-isoaspartate(D-aspartate) O-methyltransferase [Natronomonas gomsonensis]
MFRRDDDADSDFETRRERMVEALVESGRIERESTIEALKAVPRHEFVPPERRGSAYADRPLPIGNDQTVSAPHMVGIMCDRLALSEGEAVLEIGTGCGYHAAVTAEIVGDGNVYSVEYVESLADDARNRLDDLGYDVHVRVGDGHDGWPEYAPYDAAYLTCAARELPEAVLDQLREDGRLLAPVGDRRQRLVRAVKREGGIDREEFGGVRFVPMQGGDS